MSEELRQQMPSPFMPGMKPPMSPQGAGWQNPPMPGGPCIQEPWQPQPWQPQPWPQPAPQQPWPSYPTFPQWPAPDNQLRLEESYIENILRLNRGKVATVYMTFNNNDRWNAKVFKGIIEAAGRDHIILSDVETEMRYLLLTIYLDYITFDEEINYEYPIR